MTDRSNDALELARIIVAGEKMCPYCDEYGMPDQWRDMAEELLRLHALQSEKPAMPTDEQLSTLAEDFDGALLAGFKRGWTDWEDFVRRIVREAFHRYGGVPRSTVGLHEGETR